MIIVVSSKGKEKDSLIDSMFGRCEYFYILDTKDNTVRVVENDGLEASGGAGIAAANQIIKEEADILITGFLGPNAFDIIKNSKIKAYACDKVSIEKAISMYQNNELQEITDCNKKKK